MSIINEENLEQFKTYILEGKTIPELQDIYSCSRTTITTAKKEYGLIGLSPNSKKVNRGNNTKKCTDCGIEKVYLSFTQMERVLLVNKNIKVTAKNALLKSLTIIKIK